MTGRSDSGVIIIGGRATGAGIARDCVRYGLRTPFIERHDITTGAIGCNHGLLHSGARYAVTDNEPARECISESRILRRIACHCIEPTDGLFITLPEDDLAYQQTFITVCQQAGTKAILLFPQEAPRREPIVDPTLLGMVQVPDGAIDPFRLTAANMLDVHEHDTQIFTGYGVTGPLRQGDRVCSVQVYDRQLYQVRTPYAGVVVNATGIRGQRTAEYTDLHITMFPAKGSLLILGHRISNLVVNRCRESADADILVLGNTTSLAGTTSMHIPYDDIDDNRVTAAEVDTLLREGEKLMPVMGCIRIPRAYSGVRPLAVSNNDPSGRSVSRGIVLLNHAQRDGMEGFITITGDKLMTYRLMAGWATGAVCRKLGNTIPCSTAETPLPGSQELTESTLQKIISLSTPLHGSVVYRRGDRTPAWPGDNRQHRSLACECGAVTAGEVKYVVENLAVNTLLDLHRRTRIGTGTCQGELCACRAAGLLQRFNATIPAQLLTRLSAFLNERWKGAQPIAWGDVLRESEFTRWAYLDLCGLPQEHQDEV